jgi:hypothetical protein
MRWSSFHSTRTTSSCLETRSRLATFLGKSAPRDPHALLVAAGAKPALQIRGGSPRASLRSAKLSLFVGAALAVYPEKRSKTTKLVYAWNSLAGTGDARAVASTSVDQRYFKLAAYMLNASLAYVFGVTVMHAAGENNTDAVTVAVGASALLAVIASADRTVSIKNTLKLDARVSLDRDVIVATGEAAWLLFVWSC